MTLTPAELRALYARTRPNRHGGLVHHGMDVRCDSCGVVLGTKHMSDCDQLPLTPIEILSIGGPRLLAKLLGVREK